MSHYLLIPLVVAAAANTLFAQVYEVVPRDLGSGFGGPINAIETGDFAIEGGTITLVDGEISEWDIRVTGLFSHTFTHEDPLASVEGLNIGHRNLVHIRRPQQGIILYVFI